MKHLSILTTFFLFSSFVSFNAQVDDPIVEDKAPQKFRFGLCGMGSIDWLVPEDIKKFSSAGSGVGYGWGPQLEFRINKNTMFRTGFNIYSSFGSINYSSENLSYDSTYFFFEDIDEKYVNWDDAVLVKLVCTWELWHF